MEIVTKSPGLQQVSEDIFNLLDRKSLMHCRLVNSSWKNVFDQPIFWIKKLNEINVQKGDKIDEMDTDSISENNTPDSFDDDDAINSWKMLASEINNANDLSNDFVLILIKIYQTKMLQQPLDIVVELEKVKKNPDLIKFILEHEDIYTCCTKEVIGIEGSCDPEKTLDPINLAAFYGLIDTVKILIEKYDVNDIINYFGDTPILRAVTQGHAEIVKFLATKIKAPNEPADSNGRTPVHIAANLGHTEIVKILAPHVRDLSIADLYGKTPLHLAAMNGHIEVVKFLASVMKDPNTLDQFGETPLHEAARYGHIEVVKYLMEKVQDPNIQSNHGETPIYAAAEQGHTEVVKYLASVVKNPNVADQDGDSPMHLAVRLGCTEIVKCLAEKIKDPNPPNTDGETPIEIATEEGHTEIVKILESKLEVSNVQKAKRQRLV